MPNSISSGLSSAPLTYAIVGTGALGGFYGARLQQAGSEVHFLLNRDYEHVHQQGLTVESPDGNFRLPHVNAYNQVTAMPACDVVIVALKTTQNHWLPQLLPPLVKEDGVVLVLQNGLGIEAEVATLVGSDRVMGGMCFLCSNKVAPGHIRHLDYKEIILAEYAPYYASCSISDRLEQIAADFERAQIAIERSTDLLISRWRKLVWNIPFNGLSVVLNATTEQLIADQHTRLLAEALMEEVLQGATAYVRQRNQQLNRSPEGQEIEAIPGSYVATMLDYTTRMKPYRTSMKIDYDERRPLETEAIFGNPLRMAAAAGVNLPRIETLYRQLKFLDQQNRQHHLP